MRSALILAVLVGGVVAVAAQSPQPAFDVVSIKRNVSGSFPISPQARPGGSFVSTNSTLESVVRFAYNLPDYRIVGGPAWVRADRFDIEARAGQDVASEGLRLMVQALLKERFQLVVRREPREMPIYALRRARNDKQLGPNLRQSIPDCALPTGRGETLDERRTPNGAVATRRTCASMAALVASLSNALQGPVDDGTALTGLWDYELSFTGERRRSADSVAVAGDANDAPALFTALQEQLGLKLEPTRGAVEVLVIESVERPTPD
jgi:uncharacterized protein (TIGR03435 family)